MEPLKRFVLRKHGNMALIAFLPVWLVGAALMSGMLLYGQVTEPAKYPELWLLLAGILAVSTFVLRIWLWHLRGKEVVSAYRLHIDIERRGSFLYPPRSIAVDEIDAIGTAISNETPRWIRWWGLSGGRVRIAYLGRSVLFGQDLPQKMAEDIVQELNDLYGHSLPIPPRGTFESGGKPSLVQR